ncbi:hypothetical protein EII17_07020 [Clostridiales bacterium COT073_COT-073]|nr:hypothetical protein EII17_07020 [Clostridiales bacterium COT073_COT-073]
MTDTQKYIKTVKVDEIPWHRLTTTYKRATDFPKYFDVLWKMENLEEVQKAGKEIAINIEHQSTLWHATPFALIFLLRIFEYASEKRESNKVANYITEQLLELFTEIAEGSWDMEKIEHAEPLADFSDMLKEEYLWSEEYDEEKDAMRYEEGQVFPDDLFYSFYYYSYQVLLLCKPLLDQLNDKRAKELFGWL